ncbi:hypothetical protein QJS10_CPA08g01211 [Acorus calamus]|uniref:Uncharacterized protein n=1 Tax=Acorus calamus TaxID=4465 RepID=A0AAV9EAC6_ACOCL|nr:hypothetical protein QJS10_CPA08g01211 [Acorus calamus]
MFEKSVKANSGGGEDEAEEDCEGDVLGLGYTTSPLITPTGIANLSISDGDRVEFELNSEEEEKAIRERRFYLHPSPRSRPGEGDMAGP